MPVSAATTASLNDALATLFAELTNGAGSDACWTLNQNDPGLLRSVDALSAESASRVGPNGGAPIAAHVDHLCYGLELLLRWSEGEENPFADADYSRSWRLGPVSDEQWAALRRRLRDDTNKWLAVIREPRPMSQVELTGVVASVVHLAYHLGAMRQIDRAIRGPAARD
jgi:hypothetical protein